MKRSRQHSAGIRGCAGVAAAGGLERDEGKRGGGRRRMGREAERGGASRRSPSPPGRRRRWTGGHSLLPDGVPTNPSRGRHPGGPVTPQHAGRLSG